MNEKRSFMGSISSHDPQWLRITFVVLLFSVTILGIGLATLLYFGKTHEGAYVDKDKYQAVFLTNGQVYFGQINKATDEFLDVQDIFYLNSQSQDATATNKEDESDSTSFSLVKLGCELHGPTDQMVINRQQISFWENLSDDGKVAKAISKWQSEHPDGLKCEETSNSTQQSATDTEESTAPKQ